MLVNYSPWLVLAYLKCTLLVIQTLLCHSGFTCNLFPFSLHIYLSSWVIGT